MKNVESRCCRVSTENTSVLDARLTSSVSIDAPRDYRASYRESRQRGKMGLARRGEVDRSRGNKDSGDLRPDKRESSILIPARVCVYTSFSRTHAFVYVHSPDIRGETCYCVMISERFVASRCNPAGISTIDVCSTL